MNLDAYGGIIPPLTTPFDRSGDLTPNDLSAMVRLLEPDVDGFLVLGSNGEAVFLAADERRQVLAAARSAIPGHKPMLVGTGGEATRTVLEQTRQAADLGADAALVLPPHYYLTAMTEAVLERHFETVAAASPIPVFLYNVPAATTLRLSPELIGRLSQHPSIVGIKDSTGDIGAMIETRRLASPAFRVLTGHAPTLLPALAVGAAGGILAVANLIPQPYQQLLAAVGRGELDPARELQARFNPLALAVTARFGVAGLKAALREMGRPAGYPRAPLRDPQQADRAVLEQLVAQAVERLRS